MNTKYLLIMILLTSLCFASWSVNDCKSKCSELDMKFTAWASDSPAETCNNVQQEGPDNNGLVTFSCEGSDGTDVFACGCRTQCADGVDNDNGGKIDLNDAGCDDKKDNGEIGDCQDTQDNDAGGKIDMQDPGCSDLEDDLDETSQCQDGLDNDGDGKVDMDDGGCTEPEDNSETVACQDGLDNDLGGKVDLEDPGCENEDDDDETSECQDFADNDGDNGIDMQDPGCSDLEDNREEQSLCKFSVLITGGVDDINNDPFFWRETLQKYKMITDTWKTSPENTYLLYFNGSINRTTGDARIDGPATLAEIENTFEEIANKAKECTDRCDSVEITIFLGNHGAPDGTNLYGAEKLSPAKLRELINKIKNKANGNKVSVWLDASNCYSGIFTQLGDLVDGVATAVQHNETAGYNDALGLSFQIEFANALTANKSWRDSWEFAKNKTVEWGWNVGNDSEHPQYNGTGAICGDGKLAKSSLYGNQREQCDPGDPSKGIPAIICPGEQVCIDCLCYYPYYYLDCIDDYCVMDWSTIPLADHELCDSEGEYCGYGDEDEFYYYLDCIDDYCAMMESDVPMEDNILCSEEGEYCGEDIVVHTYLDCVQDYCIMVESEAPEDNYPGCTYNGQYCGEEIPTTDTDEDGVIDSEDNCPETPNSAQSDVDEDGIGDLCDPCPYDYWDDWDADGLCAEEDNCEDDYNPGQEDSDEDAIGNVCDVCPNDAQNDVDNDWLCAGEDNCPNVYNPFQEDEDGDGVGSACDTTPLDCNEYCLEEGRVAIGQGGISALTCETLTNQLESKQCYTRCAYAYYSAFIWGPNSYSCCCRSAIYDYPCNDCPGQNPTCPDCPLDEPSGE